LPSSSKWPWEDMIAEFRALGGMIDNLRLGTGPRGRGLFVCDNTRPVCLRLPENLLFRADDIEFVGDRIRLKDTAFVGRAEREFFEKYQENYSWGAGGRAEWLAFETALDVLPAEIRALLVAEFGMANRLEGDAIERAGRQFLGSRQISWKDTIVIMPLSELANNGEDGLRYETGADLRIEGTVTNEVVVSYGPHDSFSLLSAYGYAGPALGAFSLPMKMTVGANELAIGFDIDRSTQRGSYRLPEFTREGSGVSLSHLLLGHAPYPSLPRGIFCALTKELFGGKTDEIFDRVRHFNRSKFLQLLAELEPHEGPMIDTLSKMARFQLEAMSWSIGCADLDAPVPSPWTETQGLRTKRVSVHTGWTWEEMLDAFRGLGGVAENVRLSYGVFGRGLFTADRTRPFQLRVPQKLLFPASEITFAGGKIGIREDASIAAPEREFFSRYQEAFSWGGGGERESASFVAALDSLPQEVRGLLAAQLGMRDMLDGDAAGRAQEHFLRSRTINWNGRAHVAPLAELVNHGPDSGLFYGADFLGIAGRSAGEIFVPYRAADAFAFFRRFGFATPEPAAFCLAMIAQIKDVELIIKRNIGPQAESQTVLIPQMRRDKNRVELSFLPLGHPGFPNVPRGLFRSLMRSAGIADAEVDEAFDSILHFNRTRFIGLLDALSPHDGSLVVTLRRMARIQLEAMSWCIGAREI
jgi:hypothetical protein